MADTPGYLSNAELAAQISALVNRWNTRENQMIALLSQESGSVTVTDALGQDHVLPSMRQLATDVAVLVDDLSGAVSQTFIHANNALASRTAAEAAAAAATSAAAGVADAVSTATTAAVAAEGHAAVAGSAAATASGAATTASGAAGTASADASIASSSRIAAEAAEDKAALWADAPQGTQVEPGKFSAKHWAAQAAATVTGTLVYMGPWNAASGSYPPSPATGHFYKVTTAGTHGGYQFNVGDQIVYNGSGWDVIDNTDKVSSVAGKSGAVSLVAGDIGGLGALATRNDVDWTSHVTGKPSAYPPSAHAHSLSDITNLGRIAPQSLTITDWNLATENGWYMASGAANAPTADGSWYMGMVMRHNSDWVVQRVVQFAGNQNIEFQRLRALGSWTAWVRVYSTENALDERYVRSNADAVMRDGTFARGDGTGAVFLNQSKTKYLYWDLNHFTLNGSVRAEGSLAQGAAAGGARIEWNSLENGNGYTEIVNNRGGGNGGFTFWTRVQDGSALTKLAHLSSSGLLHTKGISLGAELAASVTDLSKHLTLFAPDWGISVTAGSFNVVMGGVVPFAFKTNGVQIGNGSLLSKITCSSAAPGALQVGELYLRY